MAIYRLFLLTLIGISLMACNEGTTNKKITSTTSLNPSKHYHLILLAGQSNMVGLGDLDVLKSTQLPDNVHYFNYGYDTQLNILDHTYGPEVALATILSTTFPKQEFILIKYAVGASSLYDWHPNYNKTKAKLTKHSYYNSLYTKFIQVTDSITEGYKTTPMAFIWMQGETDATSAQASKEYYKNFKALISAVRTHFNHKDLPVIYGKINPPRETHPFNTIVRKAQEDIALTMQNTYLINTDSLLKLKDDLHYNSKSNLDLGALFANKLIDLQNAP